MFKKMVQPEVANGMSHGIPLHIRHSSLINIYHVLSRLVHLHSSHPQAYVNFARVCQVKYVLGRSKFCKRQLNANQLEAPFHHVRKDGKWMEMAFFTVLSFFPFSFPALIWPTKSQPFQGQFGEARRAKDAWCTVLSGNLGSSLKHLHLCQNAWTAQTVPHCHVPSSRHR